MSFSAFFSNLRRYDENARVIFDGEEPVGQATDLVLPRSRWFQRRRTRKHLAACAEAPNDQ
jgi:hypothetical protein